MNNLHCETLPCSSSTNLLKNSTDNCKEAIDEIEEDEEEEVLIEPRLKYKRVLGDLSKVL